ncbi:HAD family hydrolase [Bacteroides heparinolyticus]|uniref:HAD family hydrolase n=1 Tax=Prevotella heparinolytica TaxID=28113 RepID=UPI0035A1C1EA
MKEIKGVIFDYGGTIDTNARHWAEVLWEQYVATGISVKKEEFREAYVHGERTLAKFPLVKPYHNFYDVLKIKTKIQFDYLKEGAWLSASATGDVEVATRCYAYVKEVLARTLPVVQRISQHYRLVLVSNFYGNIETILKDFGLNVCFAEVVESSVVGLRKPDPAIYALGVQKMGFLAEEILVVGDSFSKDVVPAKHIGCKVAWLRGEGWGDEEIDESLPDYIIEDLSELLPLLNI